MKTRRLLCLLAAALLLLAGCKGREQGGEIFQTKEGDGYLILLDGGREYVPFCAIVDTADLGDYLGHVANDPDERIYTYKDLPREQWLVSFLNTGLMPEGMLCREKTVTDIPEGLSSEYSWN